MTSNYNRVAALEAETGAVKWVYDPRAYEIGMPLLAGASAIAASRVEGFAGRQQAANLSREPVSALLLDAETGKPSRRSGWKGRSIPARI